MPLPPCGLLRRGSCDRCGPAGWRSRGEALPLPAALAYAYLCAPFSNRPAVVPHLPSDDPQYLRNDGNHGRAGAGALAPPAPGAAPTRAPRRARRSSSKSRSRYPAAPISDARTAVLPPPLPKLTCDPALLPRRPSARRSPRACCRCTTAWAGSAGGRSCFCSRACLRSSSAPASGESVSALKQAPGPAPPGQAASKAWGRGWNETAGGAPPAPVAAQTPASG